MVRIKWFMKYLKTLGKDASANCKTSPAAFDQGLEKTFPGH